MDRNSDQNIVIIRTFGSEMEAQVTKAFLQSRGIESFVMKDDLGGMQTSFQVTLGVKLAVHARDEKKATTILASANSEE